MRFAMLVAAAGAAVLSATPAQAANIYRFELSGTVSGTQTFVRGSPLPVGPFSKDFSFLTPLNNGFGESIDFGDYGPFRIFSFRIGGLPGTLYTGSFQLNMNTGVYSPLNLTYDRYAGAGFCNSAPPGSVCSESGTTATFNIRQVAGPPAVPEPATWSMMIVGFGALGFALRRRTTVTARVRFA